MQLHKDSALGEAVLECYASGNRNVFSLGFVPVAGDNTVVLLARDTPANSPAVRDLGVDMSQVCVYCVMVCNASCRLMYILLAGLTVVEVWVDSHRQRLCVSACSSSSSNRHTCGPCAQVAPTATVIARTFCSCTAMGYAYSCNDSHMTVTP